MILCHLIISGAGGKECKPKNCFFHERFLDFNLRVRSYTLLYKMEQADMNVINEPIVKCTNAFVVV
jgi:hypothetical protein